MLQTYCSYTNYNAMDAVYTCRVIVQSFYGCGLQARFSDRSMSGLHPLVLWSGLLMYRSPPFLFRTQLWIRLLTMMVVSLFG